MSSNGVVTSTWIPAGALTVISVIVTWALWPHSNSVSANPETTDFSAEQITREISFHHSIRPWQLASIAVSVLFPLMLSLVLLRIEPLRSCTPRSFTWWMLGLAVMVMNSLVVLPLQFVVLRHLRTVGLSSQSTASWLLDGTKSTCLVAAVTLPAAALLIWASQKSWTVRHLGVPAAAIASVVVMSLVVPVVVEPMFNRFSSMSESPLRDRLMSVVQRSGIQVEDILVADASRRTTALNAYVSGFAGTRRVVVYDTMVARVPEDQIAMVTAHELGHVAHHDVLRNTAVAALWMSVGAIALVAGAPLVAGVEVAWLLAVTALASQVTAPVQSAFSRAVERSADDYALELASSPQEVTAFAQVQRQLAIDNVSSLKPLRALYLMYATHPLAPERIQHAREEMARRGWGLLPSMRDT